MTTTPQVRVVLLIALATLVGGCYAPSGRRDVDFRIVGELDIGRNPHQISFSDDGRTAWVATAGEDRVTVIDATRHLVWGTIPVPGTPLGVIPVPNGRDLAVARFEQGGIARLTRVGDPLGGDRRTSSGTSLIVGPHSGDHYLVSVEQADSVHVFDASTFSFVASYPTGDRPFPGAATSDGRLAFVPGYADGTVTVIDLFNDRILETIRVGTNPSGGAVLPGDFEYAAVVRGEDRVVFINTASRLVVDELTEGIGESPFSLVVAPNGRLAFVNNTASHDISVIDLKERAVIARIRVPEIPIVMAVHPSGSELWVSSEGEHRVTIVRIPDAWRDDPRDLPAQIGDAPSAAEVRTEVAVMGMIHGSHRTSELWGLPQVEETIRNFAPDIVCTEIAPDRWHRIERDLRDRDAIDDPRVQVFPEYTDLILRLAADAGFEVVPCAGWTREMSDLRGVRIGQFNSEDRFDAPREEYARRLAELRATYTSEPTAADDPAYIHSDEYDDRQKGERALYDEYQNDLIGPGGWTNINVEHYRYVAQTVREHRGKRILVTFGAAHKYWLLEQLAERADVDLLDLQPFLSN
jgi:DNA-binding beta-propeller fold protein YncE